MGASSWEDRPLQSLKYVVLSAGHASTFPSGLIGVDSGGVWCVPCASRVTWFVVGVASRGPPYACQAGLAHATRGMRGVGGLPGGKFERLQVDDEIDREWDMARGV